MGMFGIEIKSDGKKLTVRSPYHPDFVEWARGRNGKFSGDTWTFDARDEDAARRACFDVYGTDGRDVPTCTVRFTMNDLDSKALFKLGRLIVERRGRDYRANLGPGCVVEEGGFPAWGGSVKNPRVAPQAGTVLEVRDVPVTIAREAAESFPSYYEIIGEAPEIPADEPRDVAAELAGFTTAELRGELQRRGCLLLDAVAVPDVE